MDEKRLTPGRLEALSAPRTRSGRGPPKTSRNHSARGLASLPGKRPGRVDHPMSGEEAKKRDQRCQPGRCWRDMRIALTDDLCGGCVDWRVEGAGDVVCTV